jgi:hypothetical protein
VAESVFGIVPNRSAPAFTRASPIRLPSDRKNSAPMIAEQRAHATNAERSRHHTEEKQRFVVSVVACDSLLGHQRSRPADGAGKASEHVIPVIARRACRVRPSKPLSRRAATRDYPHWLAEKAEHPLPLKRMKLHRILQAIIASFGSEEGPLAGMILEPVDRGR